MVKRWSPTYIMCRSSPTILLQLGYVCAKSKVTSREADSDPEKEEVLSRALCVKYRTTTEQRNTPDGTGDLCTVVGGRTWLAGLAKSRYVWLATLVVRTTHNGAQD